jgi:hypothetical protein
MEASNSTSNLLTDFMEPTEVKGPGTIEEAEVIIEPEPKQEEPVPDAKPATPKERMLTAETQAEIYVSVFDGIQTMVLSSINKKKLNRRLGDRLAEAEKLMNEIECGRLDPKDLHADQYGLFLRIKSMLEIKENIPFSDDEYNKLMAPLSKIIQESGHDLPPSMALTLVGLQVMAPRLVDALFE